MRELAELKSMFAYVSSADASVFVKCRFFVAWAEFCYAFLSALKANMAKDEVERFHQRDAVEQGSNV